MKVVLYKVFMHNEDNNIAEWYIVALPSETSIEKLADKLANKYDCDVEYVRLSNGPSMEITMDAYEMLEGVN